METSCSKNVHEVAKKRQMFKQKIPNVCTKNVCAFHRFFSSKEWSAISKDGSAVSLWTTNLRVGGSSPRPVKPAT